jgi:hypothetical protein
MMEITIEDGATPELRRRMAALTNRTPMMQAAGKAVEVVLKDHFRRRDGEGNKKGWPRKHFWNRIVSKATALASATADEATVKIASREFAQKLFGGPITPKSGKFLAIPLTAEAYMAGRPRNWRGGASLHAIRLPSGSLLLRESLHSSLKGRKRDRGKIQGGEAQYLLVKKVNQAADPQALPTESKLQLAARIAVSDYLKRGAQP